MHSALNRKSEIFPIWKKQWLFLLLITLFGALLSFKMAWGLLLGGMTFLLPYSYFFWKSFRHAGAAQASHIFLDLCIGQITKLVITGVLFLLIFKLLHPAMLPFFIGFFVMQCSPWLMLWTKRI